jgi:hypothetical protein
MNTEISQFPSELHFVVAIATLITVEGRDDDFSEEGDLGKKQCGLACLLAIRAKTVDNSGWVRDIGTFVLILDICEDNLGLFFLLHRLLRELIICLI